MMKKSNENWFKISKIQGYRRNTQNRRILREISKIMHISSRIFCSKLKATKRIVSFVHWWRWMLLIKLRCHSSPPGVRVCQFGFWRFNVLVQVCGSSVDWYVITLWLLKNRVELKLWCSNRKKNNTAHTIDMRSYRSDN